ncbi:MAG: ATP-binding protein [Candidatus Aenigmarchaeota archaeon]|nr:ATP-binding protein [Candidatus Aenigmarchaeota archaeon]
MEPVFEEWDTYADKKELKMRGINFESIKSNSKLKIVAITGIRRCGKTSALIILHQILSKEDEKVGYINLEDNRIKNDENVLDNIVKWFGDNGYLLLDEITNAISWENWIARNHEMLKGKLNLILSSSRRSLAIPNKPLRGRMLVYELYPLSFREFLQFKDLKVEKTTAGIGKIEKSLDEYLIYGGFPEAVLLNDKTEKIRLLNSYFKDIIGLDVAELSMEKMSVVDLFGKYIVGSSYFSASKCLNFFKSMGYKTSKQSLLHLEKCSQEGYLFFFVPIFSHKIKDRSQYPRKAYLGDTGFMYAINGKIEYGRLYENTVFLELKRHDREISYWKNSQGAEVDFVICKGLKPKQIIQVAYDIENENVRERELKGLIECAREFGLKNGLVITKSYEKNEKHDGIDIEFTSLRKWLLQ